MAIQWTENQGAPGFGPDDYQHYRSKGYSDSDIRDFITANKQYFGAGRLNVGAAVRQSLGLGGEYANDSTADVQAVRTAGGQASYERYLADLRSNEERGRSAQQLKDLQGQLGSYQSKISDYDSRISGYQSQLGGYENRIKDYDSRISGYESQLGSYRTQLDESRTRYEGELSGYQKQLEDYKKQFEDSRATYESTLKQRDEDLASARSAAETYKSQAEQYRDMSVDEQLGNLRSGISATGSGRGIGAPGSLSGGGRPVSRGGAGALMNVVNRLDATDSVLNRRGPVVDPVTAASGSTAAPPARSLASGTTARYYASRFG